MVSSQPLKCIGFFPFSLILNSPPWALVARACYKACHGHLGLVVVLVMLVCRATHGLPPQRHWFLFCFGDDSHRRDARQVCTVLFYLNCNLKNQANKPAFVCIKAARHSLPSCTLHCDTNVQRIIDAITSQSSEPPLPQRADRARSLTLSYCLLLSLTVSFKIRQAHFCRKQGGQALDAQSLPLCHHGRDVPQHTSSTAHFFEWPCFVLHPQYPGCRTQAASEDSKTCRAFCNFSQSSGVSHCAPGPESPLSINQLACVSETLLCSRSMCLHRSASSVLGRNIQKRVLQSLWPSGIGTCTVLGRKKQIQTRPSWQCAAQSSFFGEERCQPDVARTFWRTASVGNQGNRGEPPSASVARLSLLLASSFWTTRVGSRWVAPWDRDVGHLSAARSLVSARTFGSRAREGFLGGLLRFAAGQFVSEKKDLKKSRWEKTSLSGRARYLAINWDDRPQNELKQRWRQRASRTVENKMCSALGGNKWQSVTVGNQGVAS